MMSTPALVSIITPSYNQAAFLEQTMRSVLLQDYPAIEYIVVDGGSTDGSQEIIEKYAHRLKWWISEKDTGQAEAINKGFERANGEFIAWLNSDDLYCESAVSAAVTALQQNPDCGLVFSDVLSIDANAQVFNLMQFGNWGLPELLQFNIISQPGVFMRRSTLERAGGLDLNYRYLLDQHLWLRIANIAPIKHIQAYWAAARFHPQAKNIAHAAGFGSDAFRILEWLGSDPEFSATYTRYARRIRAGAYRMDARYQLDGGNPKASIKSYWRCFWSHPPTALQEFHRIGYALVSQIAPMTRLKSAYMEKRSRKVESADWQRCLGYLEKVIE
jgi:glycosyltransferase involved in cell wall biosynthesis